MLELRIFMHASQINSRILGLIRTSKRSNWNVRISAWFQKVAFFGTNTMAVNYVVNWMLNSNSGAVIQCFVNANIESHWYHFLSLKACSTEANIMQDCWPNNVAWCWMRILSRFKLKPTSSNIIQQGVQTRPTCCIRQCWMIYVGPTWCPRLNMLTVIPLGISLQWHIMINM